MMTQLNSSFLTVLQRRYLPVIFSLVMLGVLGAILMPPAPPWKVVMVALAVMVPAALIYFGVYRALIYPAADRVLLEGGMLRVNRGGKETLIPVAEVTGIRSCTMMSPETITLELADGSGGERSIVFIPPVRFPSAREHPVLAPLRALMAAG